MEGAHLTERVLREALRPDAAEELKLRVVRHVAALGCCFAVVRHLCELESCGGLGLWFPTGLEAAARLRLEAEVVWEELRGRPLAEQLALVRRTRRLRHLGLCELLCFESVRLAGRDARAARERGRSWRSAWRWRSRIGSPSRRAGGGRCERWPGRTWPMRSGCWASCARLRERCARRSAGGGRRAGRAPAGNTRRGSPGSRRRYAARKVGSRRPWSCSTWRSRRRIRARR